VKDMATPKQGGQPPKVVKCSELANATVEEFVNHLNHCTGNCAEVAHAAWIGVTGTATPQQPQPAQQQTAPAEPAQPAPAAPPRGGILGALQNFDKNMKEKFG
jgi:hypothetical protein